MNIILRITKKAFVCLFSFGLFFPTIFVGGKIYSQKAIYEAKDTLIFQSEINRAKELNLSEKSLNLILLNVAKSFSGKNYLSHPIENKGEEKIKINLSGFDCYSLVETSLAFARVIKLKKNGFNDFINEIENIRYRNGKLNGYISRLHYFTDWIYDLEKRGIVFDKTEKLDGIPYEKKINFMSKHTFLYDKLKENKKNVNKISEIENEINKRKMFYIPQEKIKKVENEINSGDIIAITTDIPGLDISHVGIAIRKNGRIYLFHAPNVGLKITISEKPLGDYVLSHKRQTGIMVIGLSGCDEEITEK